MWRIGTVPYLNARPLFDSLQGRDDVALIEAVPSQLASMLLDGALDAAMVSSVVHLAEPGLVALDAPGVTSLGPVRSIRLFSHVAPDRIRCLALDTSSRTGIVLGQLLLHRVYGVCPEAVSMPPDVREMLEVADACVLIGDPALRADRDFQVGALPPVEADLDLGALWTERTGLPFVFALWTAPARDDSADLVSLLRQAARDGIARRREIACREAPALGLPAEMCVQYLEKNVRHTLGPLEREGLALFHRWAVEDGLLPSAPAEPHLYHTGVS
jgi:chorismate dehydratase